MKRAKHRRRSRSGMTLILRVPRALLAMIDRAASAVGMARMAFIRDAAIRSANETLVADAMSNETLPHR